MRKKYLIGFYLSIHCTAVHAERLVAYDFDAAAVDQSVATVVSSGVSASALTSPMAIGYITTIGDNSGVDNDGNIFGNSDRLGCIGIGVDDATTANFTDAVAGSDYVTFTIAPEVGHELNLANLTFKASKSSGNSVDEYAVTDAAGNLIGSAAAITSIGQTTTYDGVSVDLSGAQFQNLTKPTELRIYAWGSGTTSTSGTLAMLDKIVLNGTTGSSIIVGYDFNSGSREATVSPSKVAASEFGSPMDISFVDSIGDNSGVDAYGEDFGGANSLGAVGIGVNDAITANLEAAIAGDDYVSFTVTPDPSIGMRLTGISFKATKKSVDSLDRYAIVDTEGNLIGIPTNITSVIGLTGEYSNVRVDFEGTDYEAITDTTEFRIYAWGRGSSSTFNTLAAIDKVALHGETVAIGQDYFVAINGDDSNAGTQDQPFATIQHAVDRAGPNSTIFVRGGTYRQKVDLAGVAGIEGFPVTITPFNGEKVVLDGTVDITTNWTQDEGNIYSTIIPEDISQLFVDDKLMTLARFPNALAFSDAVFTIGQARRFKSGTTNGIFNDSSGAGTSVANTGLSFVDCIGVLNFARFITDSRVIRTHEAGSARMTHDPLVSYLNSSPYFLEGGVGGAERKMIDTAQEWGYNELTNKLWLWTDDGENPNGRKITGKTETYLMTGDAETQNVIIDNINFFASTFSFESSDNITIQNCDLDYFSASTRALGDITRSATTRIVGTLSDECENITIYNCNFRHADGRALYGINTQNMVIENNLFYKIDYACSAELRATEPGSDGGSATAINLVRTDNLLYRRNTVDTAGGAQILSVNGRPSTFEFNYHTNCASQQSDGSSIYMVGAAMTDSVARNNWFYGNFKRDFRYDGNNTPLIGIGGIYYRNVSVSTVGRDSRGSAARLKGDLHEIYNNVGVGRHSDLNVARDKGGNARSITYNNAANQISDDPIPGTASNNYNGLIETRQMEDLLRDPLNFDFRPKADAVELIDQGREVFATRFDDTADEMQIPITPNYLGSAPDLGAYEFGDENYWIAGKQEAQASWPFPFDGKFESVLVDEDLMWLGGLDGVSYHVYLGTSPNNMTLIASQPNNIVGLEGLQNDQVYHWRVDTVLADSSVVIGDVWSFTVDDARFRPELIIDEEGLTLQVASDITLNGTIANIISSANGGALTYSLVSGPSGLTIGADGSLGGLIGSNQLGVNNAVIRVTDSSGQTDTVTISVTVNSPNIVVGYDFNNGTNEATLVAGNLVASALTSPMNIAYVSTIGDNTGKDALDASFGDPNLLGAIGIGVDDAVTGSFGAAVAGNDYLSFTVTPESGTPLNLDSINFLAVKRAVVSVDEYAVTDGAGNLIGSSISVNGVGELESAYERLSVDLAGTDYETITEATEFRIYVWGRGSNNTSSTLAGIDKITLHGDTNAGSISGIVTNPVFLNWLETYELSGADANLQADTQDQDGFPILLEFALGMDPTQADADSKLSSYIENVEAEEEQYFVYEYDRRLDYEELGLKYTLIVTQDLETPYSDTPFDVTIGDPTDIYETVKSRFSMDVPIKFIQLKVESE